MSYVKPADLDKRPILVVGGGTLGRRIGLMMASQGAEVRIYDTSDKGRNDAVAFIQQELPAVVKQVGGKAGTVKPVASLQDGLKDTWIVFEAIPEVLDLKIDMFGQLDQLADKNTILASNSSSYPSSQLIGKVSDAGRERVCNTHFYMPPSMNAVEVASCGKTDKAIIDLLMGIFPKYGLTPFFVRKDSVGFIFNRVWAAIKRECLEVVATGVSTPSDVERLFEVNGHTTVGPFSLMDQVGLDTVYNIESHYEDINPSLPKHSLPLLKKYLDNGRLGKKTKKGFFDYDDKGELIKKDYQYDESGYIIEK